MFSIIVSIWRCRFAMNGRKIYKTLKTHVKTHPVALLLYFFFFFIVSKPPSLSCRRGCLRSLADLCSQQKTQMLFFAYERLKGSEELVWKCSYATDETGICNCWLIKGRRNREKPLEVTANFIETTRECGLTKRRFVYLTDLLCLK